MYIGAVIVISVTYFAAGLTQVVQLGKSSSSPGNSIAKYAADISSDLTQAQQDLAAATSRIQWGGMMGAPEVVRLNMNLIKAIRGKRVLDVGFFTGFSALGAALAIPEDGKVLGMDVTRRHFDSANGESFWNYPGQGNDLRNKLDLKLAPALDTMNDLIKPRNGGRSENGTWDFCFIDADKGNQGNYYEQCLALLRPLGIITIDNSLWGGSVANAASRQRDSTVRALHELNLRIGNDPRVSAALLPIADGLWVILKNP